jgi:hypothetical protein
MLPHGTTITFDTNTLDKAVRPDRHPKDPAQAEFQFVHEALKTGTLKGFVCETMVTLEGIGRADRAKVFGSTYLAPRHSEPEVQSDGSIVHRVRLETTQPARQPLHNENMRRISAALDLGVRVLAAPRIAMPKIDDAEKRVYVYEEDETALGARLDRFHDAARAIEERGFGTTPIVKIATRLAKKAGVTEPWYRSLTRASSAEEKEIASALAEWADGDTIAAHIAYQINYLCTGDQARARISIFNPAQRTWLTQSFGVRFVTIAELAAMAR